MEVDQQAAADGSDQMMDSQAAHDLEESKGDSAANVSTDLPALACSLTHVGESETYSADCAKHADIFSILWALSETFHFGGLGSGQHGTHELNRGAIAS